MFKGACRLDDPAHRTIIFSSPFQVKEFHRLGAREKKARLAPRPDSLLKPGGVSGTVIGNRFIWKSTPDRT